MRTTKRRYKGRRQALSGMGGILDDLNAAANVTGDPYFQEVICHVNQLGQVRHGQPVQACTERPMGLPGGVGLDKVALLLRGYVFAEQNPIVYPLAAALAIGLPLLIGYRIGRQ